MEETIIINANGYGMELKKGYSKEYNLDLFCKLIYYGYSSITVDGIEKTPGQVKAIIREGD